MNKKNVDRAKFGEEEFEVEVTIKDGVTMDQEIKFTQKAKTFVKKHKVKFMAGAAVIAGVAVGAVIKQRLGDADDAFETDEMDEIEDIEPIED